MTDFRAWGTIMGPAGLTAVFGMGTGVTPPVWSPEKRPSRGEPRRSRVFGWVGHIWGSHTGFLRECGVFVLVLLTNSSRTGSIANRVTLRIGIECG